MHTCTLLSMRYIGILEGIFSSDSAAIGGHKQSIYVQDFLIRRYSSTGTKTGISQFYIY